MTAAWVIAAVLGMLLLALISGMFLLLAMGRLHLDLGWGRSLHQLGPISLRIAAPLELVFEVAAAPYRGRAPGSGVEVIARSESLVVASHYTKVHFYTARTVEAVELDSPSRIGFRHLTGPVPHAIEHFALEQIDGKTELRYEGEIGLDFFVLGRIAARYWVRPQGERAVGEHLRELRKLAEQRAARASSRESGGAVS